MKAYHGEAAVKEQYLARVRAHRAADELVQGFGYWKDGKGCAVGCTIHGGNHEAYETELGIPRMVARLEDGIFEGLPTAEAQQWPERFLEAIAPGAELGQVGDRFLHWLIADREEGVIRFAKNEAQRKAIGRVGELYAQKIAGGEVAIDQWRAARNECWNAYAAAAYAAAAYDAAYAAYAAADAAAAAADADAAADAAARYNARVRQAEKLLELLREAPAQVECEVSV